MKKLKINRYWFIGITLIIGIFLGWVIKPSSEISHDHSIEELNKQTSENEVYTCSMHPQIRTKDPGSCPLCGMDLIPVTHDEGEANPMAVSMSATAMQLASISTATVDKMKPYKILRLNGKIQADESLITSQTTHISGRIEKLLVNTTGEFVKSGQTIAFIYSPALVTAQKELFEAKKIANTNPELFEAAKEKLKNWKLTSQQVASILNNGKPTENFPILADRSGVILSKRVNLGDHVMQGASLYEVANLSKVWILFDVYESDMQWVKIGDEITYTVQSLPGKEFKGKVRFIDPVIDPKTRVAKARVETINKGSVLKPEMFVSGSLQASLSLESDAIMVPKSAVMWTGERSVVYVKEATDNNVSFVMREVKLGPALGESYIIEEGLMEGEEIAVNGTFSIDAAAQLQGKPSMMNPGGRAVVNGHNHSAQPELKESDSMESQSKQDETVSSEVKKALNVIFQDYLMLKDALVKDDMEMAKKKAASFQDNIGTISMSLFTGQSHQVWMENSAKAKKALEHAAHFQNIEEMRKAFIPLSNSMIALAKTFDPMGEVVYVQHCPMADNNKGADWISLAKEIRNPYFGSAMLTCGEVKQEIK